MPGKGAWDSLHDALPVDGGISVKGCNAKFKADPEAFLKNTGIVCSSMVRSSQVDQKRGRVRFLVYDG